MTHSILILLVGGLAIWLVVGVLAILVLVEMEEL